MAIPLEKVADSIPGDECASAYAEVDQSGDQSVSNWNYRLAVTRHHRRVFQLAAMLLRDEAEAEDVTQEVFINYWERGRGVRKPREWLLRVAHNRCMDRLRKSGRMVSTSDYEIAEPKELRDPQWHYEQKELSEQLRRLVDTLPEPQRSLLVLFDMQGLSGDECAKIIGISSNQVKVYLHRARKRLRLKLEGSQ